MSRHTFDVRAPPKQVIGLGITDHVVEPKRARLFEEAVECSVTTRSIQRAPLRDGRSTNASSVRVCGSRISCGGSGKRGNGRCRSSFARCTASEIATASGRLYYPGRRELYGSPGAPASNTSAPGLRISIVVFAIRASLRVVHCRSHIRLQPDLTDPERLAGSVWRITSEDPFC